jgi:hypothetical protein
MSLIARIFVILFAFLIASFFGGLVVTSAVVMREWTNLALGPVDDGLFMVFATFGWVFVSWFALLPALIAIVVSEIFSLRSVVFYGLAGAAIGALAYASLGGFDPALLGIDSAERREVEIMVGAGIVAGFVYWLIAGRNAGRWREPLNQTPT